MPGSATITAKVGPGNTLTSGVFTGVTFFDVNTDTKVMRMVSNGILKEFDINAATTFTVTISGGTFTITVS